MEQEKLSVQARGLIDQYRVKQKGSADLVTLTKGSSTGPRQSELIHLSESWGLVSLQMKQIPSRGSLDDEVRDLLAEQSQQYSIFFSRLSEAEVSAKLMHDSSQCQAALLSLALKDQDTSALSRLTSDSKAFLAKLTDIQKADLASACPEYGNSEKANARMTEALESIKKGEERLKEIQARTSESRG